MMGGMPLMRRGVYCIVLTVLVLESNNNYRIINACIVVGNITRVTMWRAKCATKRDKIRGLILGGKT